jgi:hypothetical protein
VDIQRDHIQGGVAEQPLNRERGHTGMDRPGAERVAEAMRVALDPRIQLQPSQERL